jgi:hypothetical protein
MAKYFNVVFILYTVCFYLYDTSRMGENLGCWLSGEIIYREEYTCSVYRVIPDVFQTTFIDGVFTRVLDL